MQRRILQLFYCPFQDPVYTTGCQLQTIGFIFYFVNMKIQNTIWYSCFLDPLFFLRPQKTARYIFAPGGSLSSYISSYSTTACIL